MEPDLGSWGGTATCGVIPTAAKCHASSKSHIRRKTPPQGKPIELMEHAITLHTSHGVQNEIVNMRNPSSVSAWKGGSCEFSQTTRIWAPDQQLQRKLMSERNRPTV
jgi:hypothetical protein